MAQVSAYSTLYPLVLPWVPGYDEVVVAQVFKRIGRDFAEKTGGWREDLPPHAVTDYQQDYSLYLPTSSFPHRIHSVKVNGGLIAMDQYELVEEAVLRFKDTCVPYSLENMLLACGTCSKTAYTDWASITDGSAGMTLGSTASDVTGLDFSSCASMDDVARVIQNGLRGEADVTYGNIRWDDVNKRFVFWTEQQVVSYLTAGSAGTDISGTDYMNGLTGTGVLSGYIMVNAVLRPHVNTDVLPDWFQDRWCEVISAGVLSEMMRMPQKPWSDPIEAPKQRRIYRNGIGSAKSEDIKLYHRSSGGLLG